MKKVCLVAIVAMFSLTSMNAQGGISAGIHLGIPTGDISDFSSFNYGLDVTYLTEISDNFHAGVTSGYTNFTGKNVTFSGDDINFTVNTGDFGFIPIAGTARFSFSDKFFGAADLGYAISTNGGTGGFYYQPKVGFQASVIDIFAFYKGISSDGATIASFGVGAAYKFD